MNVVELISNGTSINVTMSAQDLREFAATIVDTTRKELEAAITDQKAETYPSVDKVAEILDVDKSTLWRWSKRGYLVPFEVGGKRRYKMSDVQRILNGGR